MLIRFFTSSLAAGLIFAALALAPAAAGHGGGGAALGYSSTITSVRPDVPGVSLRVLDGDDRLLLVNEGKDDVVVLGYEGEPYLRITPEAAFANVRSPTHYLNEDRYAAVELPPTADAQALPEWRMIDDEPRGEWHDHRIHWMSATAPPAVLEDPGVAA